MKLDPVVARRLATLVLLAFLGFILWRLAATRGSEVQLVYDLSRIGRTDLRGLHVELHRGSDRVREADFYYPPGEAGAPLQQRHLVRLQDGRYDARFVLRFAKASEMRVSVPLTVPAPQQGPVVLRLLPSR